MNLIWESIKYVTSDPWFGASMGMTASMGIFIGAILFDGLLTEVRKGIVTIISYAFLLGIANYTRIAPIVFSGDFHNPNQPFAGLSTIFFVTIFYCLGMLMGVWVTKLAHKK